MVEEYAVHAGIMLVSPIHIDVGEPGAARKWGITDRRHVGRNKYRRKESAVGERPAADGSEPFGQFYLLQTAAVFECLIADGGHRGRDGQLVKTLAIVECQFTNGGHCGGKGD